MYNIFWFLSFFIVIYVISYGIYDQFNLKSLAKTKQNTNKNFTFSKVKKRDVYYLLSLLFFLILVPLIDKGMFLKGFILGLAYILPPIILSIIFSFFTNGFKFSEDKFLNSLFYLTLALLIVRIFSFIPFFSKFNIIYWKFLGI